MEISCNKGTLQFHQKGDSQFDIEEWFKQTNNDLDGEPFPSKKRLSDSSNENGERNLCSTYVIPKESMPHPTQDSLQDIELLPPEVAILNDLISEINQSIPLATIDLQFFKNMFKEGIDYNQLITDIRINMPTIITNLKILIDLNFTYNNISSIIYPDGDKFSEVLNIFTPYAKPLTSSYSVAQIESLLYHSGVTSNSASIGLLKYTPILNEYGITPSLSAKIFKGKAITLSRDLKNFITDLKRLKYKGYTPESIPLLYCGVEARAIKINQKLLSCNSKLSKLWKVGVTPVELALTLNAHFKNDKFNPRKVIGEIYEQIILKEHLELGVPLPSGYASQFDLEQYFDLDTNKVTMLETTQESLTPDCEILNQLIMDINLHFPEPFIDMQFFKDVYFIPPINYNMLITKIKENMPTIILNLQVLKDLGFTAKNISTIIQPGGDKFYYYLNNLATYAKSLTSYYTVAQIESLLFHTGFTTYSAIVHLLDFTPKLMDYGFTASLIATIFQKKFSFLSNQLKKFMSNLNSLINMGFTKESILVLYSGLEDQAIKINKKLFTLPSSLPKILKMRIDPNKLAKILNDHFKNEVVETQKFIKAIYNHLIHKDNNNEPKLQATQESLAEIVSAKTEIEILNDLITQINNSVPGANCSIQFFTDMFVHKDTIDYKILINNIQLNLPTIIANLNHLIDLKFTLNDISAIIYPEGNNFYNTLNYLTINAKLLTSMYTSEQITSLLFHNGNSCNSIMKNLLVLTPKFNRYGITPELISVIFYHKYGRLNGHLNDFIAALYAFERAGFTPESLSLLYLGVWESAIAINKKLLSRTNKTMLTDILRMGVDSTKLVLVLNAHFKNKEIKIDDVIKLVHHKCKHPPRAKITKPAHFNLDVINQLFEKH